MFRQFIDPTAPDGAGGSIDWGTKKPSLEGAASA
ncbi:MAG: hypothetical protein S4CHLAM107_11830 [Chlamydiia bacterium]|nr:hypothetical protein [Chlamydiia bacterium]